MIILGPPGGGNGFFGKPEFMVAKPRKIGPPTELEIRQIRLCYESGGKATDLARRLRKPYHWILRVAEREGFSIPKYQRRQDWKLEELKIIENNLHLTADTIKLKLGAAGYQRSVRSICDKIRTRFGGFDKNPDIWTANEMSVLLGCAPSTVKKWIEDKKLTTLKDNMGFHISINDFKQFVFMYPLSLEYRKIPPSSWVWFLETISGKKIFHERLQSNLMKDKNEHD